MLADRVDEARDEQVTGGLRPGKKNAHKIAGALLIQFLPGPTLRIQECPLGFPPLQEALFKQPVERGHHRGVSEGPLELSGDFTDVALAAGPEYVHDLNFEWAEAGLGEAEQREF